MAYILLSIGMKNTLQKSSFKLGKNYKLCVIGAGRWGLNHIKTLDKLNALGGIVDNNSSVINNLKMLYHDCLFFSDLNDSFEANFDGYIVSAPAKEHYKIAMQIINKGKPVLVEKPITLKLSEAIKLNALAKLKKVNLMVGHLLLFHPAFKKIKELIDGGSIGKLQYIYSNRLNLGSFRTDENVFWSFAPHDIALFNHFFNSLPTELSSNGIDILQKGIHDTTISSFKYSQNRMGHIFVSWLHPFKEHRFVIIGSEGMIHYEDGGLKKSLILYDKTVDLNGEVPKSVDLGKSFEINYKDAMPLTEELKYFISKIDGGTIDIADGDSAVDVMKVLENASERLNS